MRYLLILLFSWICTDAGAQVTILSAQFNAYNVTPDGMCLASLSNSGGEADVFLEARIMNGSNQPVLTVQTALFKLRSGLTNTSQAGLKLSSIVYGGSSDAEYMRTMHQLPSGKYRYCLYVRGTGTIEGDEYCDEFENESTSFLFLVNPPDKDTIETPNPLLLWNHSEPFSLLHQGEMYRMMIVELNKDQGAEAGINVNPPKYMANFLTRHDVIYPFDATRLEAGRRYGWQVQKVANGVITNKTEAWEFVMKPGKTASNNKYVEVGTGENSQVYVAEGRKLFFVFNEAYYSPGKALKVAIVNDRGEPLKNVKARDDKKEGQKINVKENGHNRYEIDLDELGLEAGFYSLLITNEKGQASKLKFYVQ